MIITPLIDTFENLKPQRRALQDNSYQDDYPQLSVFLLSIESNVPRARLELIFVMEFLYLMGRKSSGTYLRFRNEIERWCLYCWQHHRRGIFDVTRKDIESYVDFVYQPDKTWIGTSVVRGCSFLD